MIAVLVAGAAVGATALMASDSHAAGTAATADPGIVDQAAAWVLAKQRELHRDLTASMRALAREGSLATGWTLILISFLYGVFHAAGPGHGKAVIASYLITQREKVRRGVLLAVASAFTQGLVAILLVYGLIGVTGWLPRDTQMAVTWSERLSYVLVAGIGGMLIYRAVGKRLRRAAAGGAGGAHDHGHDHDHDHCGHNHGPSAEQIERAGDLRTAAGVVLSVGLRPCTGSIVVLVFAKVVHLTWAGVAAVAAISAGTAITVAAIAYAAINARAWTARHSGMDARKAALVGDIVGAVGGGLIFWMGATLLAASFGPAHPLGL